MPKSRTNKDRKDKLEKYKAKHKVNMEKQQVPVNPKVRQIPKWKSDDKITVSGLEWEAIYNYLLSSRAAHVAADSVMNRAILDGVVEVDFEKINDEGSDYVPMSDEEQKPYKEDFQKMIEEIKKKQAEPKKEEAKIVDINGNPAS